MSFGKALSRRVLVALLLAASGCSLGPDYERPEFELSQTFREDSKSGESIANLMWWEVFRDKQLGEHVKIALQENKDLLRAVARIDEARALLGITRADQFPTIDIAGNADRTNPSDVSAFTFGAPANDFGGFGQLFYEIDLWGKLRRATEAQRAELISSEYAYRTVTIALVSQVAQVYFQLLDADERIRISQRTLKNRQDATRLINERFKGGTIPELDLNQAQIEEADVLAQLASFTREMRQFENAMSVLLGSYSIPIRRSGFPQRDMLLAELPTGVPADLLERRPDVSAAEEALHAAVARIGVAQAQRLPSVSLTGFIGLQSEDTGDFFDGDARTWSIGGGLLGPLIDFGRSRSRVEVADARAEQAYRSYEQSVLIAIQEVEDSLVAINTFDSEYQARSLQRKAAANAAKLSRARYNDGVAPYLEVLDIERSLLDAELASSSTMQRLLVSIVQLYQALGGGWTPPVEEGKGSENG